MVFVLYGRFCKRVKRGRKKKLSQFVKSHISGTLEAILLKFGMSSTDVERHVHSKNCLVS